VVRLNAINTVPRRFGKQVERLAIDAKIVVITLLLEKARNQTPGRLMASAVGRNECFVSARGYV
jgi:hypothetical protein